MNNNLWQKYEQTELNSKIVYFVDTWSESCQQIQDPNIDFDIMTPHYICKEIYDEISFNKLANKANKKYYRDILYKHSKLKFIFGDIKSLFILLAKELENPRIKIIEVILKKLFDIFNEGIYFNNVFNELKNILFGTIELNNCKSDIIILTNHIIIEYLLKGYNIKVVEKIIYNIFDKYIIWENETVITNYPHDIDYKNYNNKEEEYRQILKNLIDSLTFEQRFEKLKYYFEKQDEQYHYIFHINGISSSLDFKSGNVTFYNPFKTKYVKNKNHLGDGEYDKNEMDQNSINAIVNIKTIDPIQGEKLGISEIEKALEILRFFSNSKAPLNIDKGMRITLNNDYEVISESLSMSDKAVNYHNKLKFDRDLYTQESIKKHSGLIINNISLSNSLHYYKKAYESISLEDKILNYWVSFENIFSDLRPEHIFIKDDNITKIALIVEYLSKELVMDIIYNVGWDNYYFIDYLANRTNGDNINLPEKLKKQAGIYHSDDTVGKTIYLYKYINEIDNILNCISDNYLVDKINGVKEFYFNNTFAFSKINELTKYLEMEITFIYKLRNKIVHNASFQNRFLEFYVEKIKFFASSLLNTIISTDKLNDFEDILIKKYFDYIQLHDKLKNDNKYTLYDYIKKG